MENNETCTWTTTKTGYRIECAVENDTDEVRYAGKRIDTTHCAFCNADTEEVN
jgi:hypothetical protein